MPSTSARAVEMNSPFLNRQYGQYTSVLLEALEKEGKGGPRSAALLSNMAVAEYELEMYRKCISSAAAARKLDPSCLRAALIQCQALLKLDRPSEVAAVCTEALNGDACLYGDPYLARELRDLKQSLPVAAAANSSCTTSSNSR